MSQLQSNFLEIIELNKKLEQETNYEELWYKPMTEVSEGIEQTMETVTIKIEGFRNKIKTLQQQTLLLQYISNPELLEGRRIKHKFSQLKRSSGL